MNGDRNPIDRQAADWFLRLDETPEDAALREGFEQWLDTDPAHVTAWLRVSEAAGLMAEAPRVLWDAVVPVPARRSFAGPVRRRVIAVAMALAACVVAALIVPAVWLSLRADLRSPHGQVQTQRLADGSLISLGPDSALRVDTDDTQRRVRLLKGRAWFEVSPDPERPFLVEAGDVTTRVLGTGFDVSREAGTVHVSVGHGRVRVEREGDSRELSSGQWVRLSPEEASGGALPADQIGLWREGVLLVRDRPVREVVEAIRPWYRGRILLIGKDADTRRVSGAYDMRDPVAALRSLTYRDGWKMRQAGSWLIVIESD